MNLLYRSQIAERVRKFYDKCPFNFPEDSDLSVDLIKKTPPDIDIYCPPLVDELRGRFNIPFVKGSRGMGGIRMSVAMTKLFHSCRKKSILEIGSGAGHLINSTSYHYGVKCVGIDFCEKAIEYSREVAKKLKCNSEFVHKDIFDFFPKEKYPVIISMGVLHHTGDCHGAISHIIRNCLQPGGCLAIGLYHKYGRKPFLDHFQKMKERGSVDEMRESFSSMFKGGANERMIESWFRDQVLHPHETQHLLSEIAPLMQSEGVDVVSTSINSFKEISSIGDVFSSEDRMMDVGNKRLLERSYFPGFFVVFGKKIKGESNGN